MRLAGLVVAALVLSACGEEDRADQEAFCTELRRSIDQNVTVFDPQDPADPAEASDTLDELVALAPEEIEPDVVVLRDAFSDLADTIAELDLNDPDAAARLAEVEVDEERIARAQAAMADYARDPCRIPLLDGPGGASTTTTPPVTTTSPTTAPPATDVSPPSTEPAATVID